MFYVCKMVGTGTEEDPYRSYIADIFRVTLTQVGEIGKGCLCYVADPTPELEADPKVHALPKKMNFAFEPHEWERIAARLENAGFNPPAYDPDRTALQLIRWIGRKLEPDFDIKQFRASRVVE